MHSITNINRSKSRKNNSRRAFRNKMAGYSSSNNRHGGYTPLFSVLALLLSAILLGACPDSNNGGDSNNTPALSTAVTNITISNITPTALTLNWTNPADSDGFEGVLISAEPAGGTVATPQQQAASATMVEITELNPITTYSFTLTSTYDDEGKNNAIPAPPAMTATSANLPIDADGDGFVDITSLERLNNIRYNLDLGAAADSTAGTLADDGRYKTSEADEGVQCGTAQGTACMGYELIISLDFTNPNHYESGELNAAWRPNSMANNSGTILPQTMADNGQNNGWEPIGTTSVGNRFNSRFEGNGHTISNLYIRRSGNIGLFGSTDSAAVIRSIGVAAVQLYGTGAASDTDTMGALVGGVSSGIVVASYASGAIIGGSANNRIGGLVGESVDDSAVVVASYAAVSIISDGLNGSRAGGLVGRIGVSMSSIIASYASGAVNGGNNGDGIAGLTGESNSATAFINAVYATGTVTGGSGLDIIGGLIGTGGLVTAIASYVDGGAGSGFVGALAGRSVTTTASYGFGAIMNAENAGIDGPDPRPEDIAMVGSGIAGARMLTLDTAGPEWNDADHFTLNAWDFGNSTQAPALRYADYDGDGDKYGCIDANSPTSTATVVIPSVVATPTGPMTITCGTTLLPEQVR